jgi:thioredoxin-related protein
MCLLFMPLVLNAQFDSINRGIEFEQGLSWEQVLVKAKTENKYIFADCFATWCMPCKKMEKDVFSNVLVGNYFKGKFISIRIQMDSSKTDTEEVKRSYAEAHTIMQQYDITSFPSYLFFSPEGKLVHRDLGFKNLNEFILIAQKATNPREQYYTLLEEYQHGKKNFSVMPYLATTSMDLRQKDLSMTIAKDYINNYLLALSDNKLYTKKNIEFIVNFIQSTKEKSFNLFYQHESKVDSIMQERGYGQRVADYVITKEEISLLLDVANKEGSIPRWNWIAKSIKRKYGIKYADRIVLDAKIRWYRKNKNWPKYINFMVTRVEKYGAFGIGILDFDLNNHSWDIFLYSHKKAFLKKALIWSDSAVRMNNDGNKASWMDTYANLLYKLGRKEEAIAVETKAAELNSKDELIRETLSKMRKGIPTWFEK